MNKTMQNRFGGVPSAHNGNTKTRFFRKPIAMLLLLAALVMAGGKAWGQVTWNGQISDNSGGGFIHYPTGTIITVTGNVYLKAPLLVWSGQSITIQTDGGGPYTISMDSNFNQNLTPTMIHIGWPGSVGILTINGDNKLIIDAGGTSFGHRKCFNILASSSCIINETTIRNGYHGTGGGAIWNEGALNCSNCVISDHIGAQGGAIYNAAGAGVVINNCTFNGSLANRGGAIYNLGNTNITGGSFNSNYTNGDNGGAIVNHGSGVLTVTGASFTGNYTIENGGAIFNDSNASPLSTLITSCTFIGNHAKVGGAIFNSTTMTINGTSALKSTFGDGTDGNKNYAFQGGAIYNNGSTLDMSYCDLNVNKTINSSGFSNGGDGGGALFNYSGTTACTNCTFIGNEAYHDGNNSHGHGFGGAILNRGTLSCSNNCSFTSNKAYVGGGICSFEKVTVTNCTFTSNIASGTNGGNGGGLYQANSSTSNPSVVTSCEFNGNSANAGGGIFSSGYLRITEASGSQTLIHNNGILSGGTGGGGIFTNGIVDMEAGKIYNNATNIPNGGGVYVAVITHSGDFRLKGSSAIYSNTATGYGGGVYVVSGATFTMSGSSNIGASGGNSATLGGGIYSEGTVTINGGQIVNNAISGNGGGAYVAGGTFSMSSGSIGTSGNANSANKGGGVYVSGGTFNLSGGNVQYNTNSGSDKHGAGIYLASGSVSMTGGKVNNNTGATQGGGVYVAGGTFGLSSGEIISNSAGAGGGVYQAGGTFNQSDGYIGKLSYGNTSTGYGAGVNLAGGTLAMSGGQIVHNSSNSYGGGVYKAAGTLRVTGAPVIKDNLHGSSANDVFLNNATVKYVLIGAAGLQCGAEIGIFKTTSSDSKIVEAEGSNAAANANYAMRNRLFFDDRGSNIGSSTSSPYYNVSSSVLYLVSGTAPAWSQTTQPSGYTVSGGSTITISSAQGLAYMAHQVNSGADTYSGKTVQLSADINLTGNKWVPIGYMTECDRDPLNPEGFKGTFDGQGHTIYNMDCDHPFYDNAGLFGIVRGGTVKNLMVSGTITNASANLGGIVGEMIGGTVYNCMATVTPSGGSNRGALVGKITSGSVKNCYAISNAAAAGSGSVTNCYVRKASGGTSANMGTATNVGSGTTGTFTATQTPYLYKHADNRVGSTSLLTLLNQWVDGQSSPADLAHWSRTMASPINGDYPILMYDNLSMTCVGTKSATPELLKYGTSLNTMLGNQYNGNGDNIYFWGTESGITYSQRNGNIYFSEDAAIIHTGSSIIEHAHVGITVDNTNGSAGVHWHMFSPALSDAPLGVNYASNNTEYPFSTGHPSGMPYFRFYPESNANHGYFPSMDYGWAAAHNFTYNDNNTVANDYGNYYGDWDYYCYFEKEYHWINFKRNSNSHWHEDGNHDKITYTNESTMTQGKGYLVATTADCLLEAKGTLNQGAININVTKNGAYRTGYNFLGNPYLSYFDFDAFASYNGGSGNDNRKLWSGNSVSNASYIILDKNGYTSYAYGSSSNPFGANRYLHPHQGFMIVVEGDATKAYFTNAMRDITHTAAFRDDHIDYPLVNLIVTEEDGNRDITTIEVGRPEVGGAFKYYDMHLGKGCIYTRYEDQDYAIVFTLPGTDQVGVRFETDEDATYTMTWDTENGEFSYLHLIDNITGSDIDCLQAREYRFTAKASDYKSRFKLMFGYTGVEENEDGPSTGSGTFAFIMGNELVVNCGPSTPSAGSGTATLQMFDMMGRQVMSTTVSGTQTTTMLPNVTAGVYVLRLSDRINGTRTQKIVIE